MSLWSLALPLIFWKLWVFKNIKRYGGNPDSVILSGHSAGGYLIMMLGLDKGWLAKYGVDANNIKALIPFSGQAITHFTIRKERNIPDTQPLIDKFAPLYYVRKDASPLILITGDRELELLGRYEENAYLMRMMKLVGHKKTELYELDGFDHVEMVRPAYNLLLKYLNH
jgi:acetyl esterase/lipase